MFQGAGREEKPLKATFTAWMGCRCIDRVVIMVQRGVGGVFMGFCCGSFMEEEDRLQKGWGCGLGY